MCDIVVVSWHPISANILRSNRSCNLDLSLDIKQNQTSSSKNWTSWEDLENLKNVRVNEKCFFLDYDNLSIIFLAISISIIPSNHVDIDDDTDNDIDDDIKYYIINDLTMTLTMTRRRRDKKCQHGSDGASRARIVLINQNRSNSEP